MHIKPVLNIIKNYRWQSLFFSYWKIMIIAFAIPILIIFLIFFGFYNMSHQKELEHLTVVSASKSREVMKVVNNDLENFFNNMISDEFVHKLLEADDAEPNTVDNQEIYYKVQNKLRSFETEYGFIDSIFLYADKSKYVVSTKMSAAFDKHPMNEFLKSCINSNQSMTVNYIESEPDKDKISCITMTYAMMTSQYRKADGFLIVNINSELLANYLENDYSDEQIIILSSDGTIIHSPVGDEQDDYGDFYNKNIKVLETDDYLTWHKGENSYCFFQAADMGAVFAIKVPVAGMKTMMSSYIGTIIFLIVFLIIIIFIISAYTSFAMYKSIAEVISTFGIVSDSEIEQKNEINMISDNFLSMLNREKDIEEQLADKVKKLKQSQILALQNQINPHFLFNTLHLVNLMILKITGEDNRPARIITLLSDIMQYTMRSEGYMTLLNDEIEYVRKYVEIEQIKSNFSFDFDVMVDEELLSCTVIKFTLQPILENCIIHGFNKNKTAEKRIVLFAEIQDNALCISISDNGNGIGADVAQMLNEQFNSDDCEVNPRHIGLTNVNNRIKLLCGEAYGVKIVPLNRGVRTEITYPLK